MPGNRSVGSSVPSCPRAQRYGADYLRRCHTCQGVQEGGLARSASAHDRRQAGWLDDAAALDGHGQGAWQRLGVVSALRGESLVIYGLGRLVQALEPVARKHRFGEKSLVHIGVRCQLWRKVADVGSLLCASA
jgi:hypothetical protein